MDADHQTLLDELDALPGLALSRWPNQRVIIELPDGRNMSIEIAEVRHTAKVRLYFKAPADVKIWREELLEEKQRGAA